MRNLSTATVLPLVIVTAFACRPSGDELGGDPLGTPGAHEHGVARLNLAVDGTEVTAELSVPGMAAFGFEHEPTSEADLAAIEQATRAVERRFTELIALDPELACGVHDVDAAVTGETEEHASSPGAAHEDHPDPVHGHPGDEHAEAERTGHADHHADDEGDSEHSELTAHAVFRCQRDPTGSEVGLGIADLFPEVERVDLQVLSNERQAGARVAADTRFRL